MKQAILYGAGDLRIEERPLDINSLTDHQVYVETEVTALLVAVACVLSLSSATLSLLWFNRLL